MEIARSLAQSSVDQPVDRDAPSPAPRAGWSYTTRKAPVPAMWDEMALRRRRCCCCCAAAAAAAAAGPPAVVAAVAVAGAAAVAARGFRSAVECITSQWGEAGAESASMLVMADAEATERLTHTRALSSCSPVPGKPRPSPLWLLSSADAVPAPVGALGVLPGGGAGLGCAGRRLNEARGGRRRQRRLAAALVQVICGWYGLSVCQNGKGSGLAPMHTFKKATHMGGPCAPRGGGGAGAPALHASPLPCTRTPALALPDHAMAGLGGVAHALGRGLHAGDCAPARHACPERALRRRRRATAACCCCCSVRGLACARGEVAAAALVPLGGLCCAL